MRIITFSTATALALTGRVFAAVAAVPTGEGDGLVIERPTLVERQGVTQVASIIAHEQSCLNYFYTAGTWDTKNCAMSDLFPPAVGITTLTVPPPATVTEESEFAAAATEDPTLLERQDVSQLASIIASKAHEQACLNYLYTAGKWDTELCAMTYFFPPRATIAVTTTLPTTAVEESLVSQVLASATKGPTIAKRRADMSKLASIIASEAHERACLSDETACNHVPGCPTLFFPPRAVSITTTLSVPPVQASASAGEVAHAVEMISKADPFGPLGSAIASYAHSIACSKIGLLNAWCDATTSAIRRDALADATTTVHTTVQSTSTVVATTTQPPWEGPPAGPDSLWPFGHGRPGDFSPPSNVAFRIDPISTTITNPTGSVTVVVTSVTKYVTIQTTHVKPTLISITSTTTTIPTTISTLICSSNASIETQSYLNISTWSMTSCSTCTPPISSSRSISASNSSSLAGPHAQTTRAKGHGSTTTIMNSESSAAIPGFGNPTTSILGSSAALSGKAELSGFHFPIGVVVAAMGACFVLALFL